MTGPSAPAEAIPADSTADQRERSDRQASRDDRENMSTDEAGRAAWSSWSNLWQMPVILVSTALIGIGLYASMRPPSPNDFDGASRQIEQSIVAGRFEDADRVLHQMIEPHLGQATPQQQARFYALRGDLVSSIMAATGSHDDVQNQRVIESYRAAEELGLTISAGRLEHWARASIDLGDFESARNRLKAMDALEQASTGDPSAVEAVHVGRNRVFRLLVETCLRRPDVSSDEVMHTLTEYRNDEDLAPEDDAWAMARQAEIRLNSNQAPKAIESLLVDMRRLESREVAISPSTLGAMHTLLGRAYFITGDDTRALGHLNQALEQFTGPEPERGDALVLLGRIALNRGDPDTALEKFHIVVRDCIGTSAYLPGMLGRAEAQSILGDHEQAMADYTALRDLLAKSKPRRDMTPQIVAESLCHRHDASLALGRLELAVEYATLAESSFDSEHVPADVLIRLGSTHRQIADNILAAARALARTAGDDESGVTAEDRVKANSHYELAGDNYLRHTANLNDDQVGEADWFASLWLAADSYDRGGRQDLAVRYFTKYLDGSSIEDQRRAETLYRLGRAHHAELNYDDAIRAYEQVLSESPRSTFAAHVHVPLARCYLAANRRPEAEQQLREVLAGDRLLKPDAQDYQDALIELGLIAYENNDFTAAIERLTEARERYPSDPRWIETLFRLADSYRSSATLLEERLSQSPPPPPAEQNRLSALRTEHLQKSLDLFGQLSDAVAADAQSSLNGLQQDMVRRAHLYRADAAFHLGQYAEAISWYDRAARWCSGHASSMYALVQIVNCYSALGDSERAAAAHHRALVRLKQLPDAAFEAADSLMDRSAWERWLDHSPVVPFSTASASANPR